MPARYLHELDGYVFPDNEEPAYGPIIDVPKRRYSVQEVIGHSGKGGDVSTYLGNSSRVWNLVSRASLATMTKLVDVYNKGNTASLWKNPQNPAGFNVYMEDLDIDYQEAAGGISGGTYMCRFKLRRR